jgi:hypothetical protein
LPELPAPGGSQLRFYPDQPELTDKVNADGFAGRRTERAAIIAPQAGRYVVPGMTIPWWNTETGSWETAELPSRDIDVVSLAPATDALVAGDAFPADGEDAPGDTARADSPFLVELVWLLAVGWLATLLAWSYTSRRNRSQRGHRRERQRLSGQRARAATRQARHAAVRACREGGAKDCRTAVLEWARLEWPEANVRTLAGAAAIAGGELAAQILELESALYSPDTIEWSPDGLAAVLRRYDRVRLGQPSRDESALAPLHP